MVVVALTAAVLAVGLVVVSAMMVWRSVRSLRATVDTARGRLGPLSDELAAEQATLQLELDGLQRRMSGDRRDGRQPPTEAGRQAVQ